MNYLSSAGSSRFARAIASFGVLVLLLAFSWFAHPHIKDVTKPFTAQNGLAYLVIAIPLVVAIIAMRPLGRRWSDYGMNRALPAWKVLLYAIAAFVGIMLLMQYVLVPVIYRIDATPPDISHLLAVRANTVGYVVVLVGVWLTAAFGEEMLFRGFIMNEMAAAFGGGRTAWISSALVIGVFFAFGHAYQGLSGILITGSIGLLLNFLYLAVGRNLWVLILVHGLIDTYSMTRIYLA